jgi:hypothetical protein
MRYKIKTTSPDTFERALNLVRQLSATIYVVSERRLMLSTGELSESAKADLVNMGARVSRDVQYQADAA